MYTRALGQYKSLDSAQKVILGDFMFKATSGGCAVVLVGRSIDLKDTQWQMVVWSNDDMDGAS